MPRVEFIPPGWEADPVRFREGTPTEDVCKDCHVEFHTAEHVSDLSTEIMGRKPDDRIGEVMVEHPPYTDDTYYCVMCDKQLTEEDD